MAVKFIIGVAGGSGSGKTTVANNIAKIIPKEHVLTLSHDWYYLNQDSKSMEDRIKTNYDHPLSLETSLLIDHLRALKAGKNIKAPQYDFVHHTRAKNTLSLTPKEVIIVEGILIFENEELRKMMDLKVFVDTDPDIRFIRRVTRDIEERGRTYESSRDQYLKFTRLMHLEFVEPSKRYADIVVLEGGENKQAIDLLTARVREIVAKV